VAGEWQVERHVMQRVIALEPDQHAGEALASVTMSV
jgi:hypothetical protein